jgi:hypothetical protein
MSGTNRHAGTTARHAERGITLTEITIVFVLASLVMTGLLTFYFNSQAVWVDGSAQAITQREATLILDAISAKARRATGAVVTGTQIDLQLPGPVPDSTYSFWLVTDAGGHRHMHQGYRSLTPPVDRGQMVLSEIMAFVAHPDTALLHIDSLRVRSASGSQVTLSTAAAFENH